MKIAYNRVQLYKFFRLCIEKRNLITMLTKREIASRYRDTYIGIIWSFVTPLMLIAIFSFVFSSIMKFKFDTGNSDLTVNYTLFIFVGLIIHSFFSETIGKMTTIILDNLPYVKKIFFHTEILIFVQVLSGLVHLFISLLLVIIFNWYLQGELSGYILYAPIVIMPFAITTLGLSFILCSASVFYRDIHQVMGSVLTGVLFCSTVFYPISSVPDSLRVLFMINPITVPIEQLRLVIFYSSEPNYVHLFCSYFVAIFILSIGLRVFSSKKMSFIDVL